MAQASNIIAFPGKSVSETPSRPQRRKTKGLRAPRAGDDRVLGYILRHQIAVADGNETDAALYLRAIIFGGAETRKGLIAMAKYLSEVTHVEFAEGTPLQQRVDGQPLVRGFFRSLASQLRRMNFEFPPEPRTSRAKAGTQSQ